MRDALKVIWKSCTGKQYDFISYTINEPIDSIIPGIYIFTEFKNKEWRPVYIGEGHIKNIISNNSLQAKIKNRGASHIHFKRMTDFNNRRFIVADILCFYPEALEPEGCNSIEDYKLHKYFFD